MTEEEILKESQKYTPVKVLKIQKCVDLYTFKSLIRFDLETVNGIKFFLTFDLDNLFEHDIGIINNEII